MKPIDFKQKTKVLQAPKGVSEEECGEMAVYTDGKYCISSWKAGFKERIKFLFTGKIWLWVWSGESQPPVCVDVHSPFKKQS